MGTVVVRAMILSSTNMAFYNEVKDFLKRVPNHSDPDKCANKFQLAVPFLHSWADSDYKKYGLSGKFHRSHSISFENFKNPHSALELV